MASGDGVSTEAPEGFARVYVGVSMFVDADGNTRITDIQWTQPLRAGAVLPVAYSDELTQPAKDGDSAVRVWKVALLGPRFEQRALFCEGGWLFVRNRLRPLA